MPAWIQISSATRAIGVKAFALFLFFLAAVLVGTQHASAQATRPKLPRAADPLARHGGSPSNVFDGFVASQHSLAANQKFHKLLLFNDLILQGCEQDLFVRNNRRANEAVQFRKFFVHIGVAAFE